MQHIIQFEAFEPIIGDASIQFFARTFILGLVTFLLFYLILKTMDQHNTRKKMLRIIREKWERLLYGEAVIVIKDGILQLDKLREVNITSQQIFNVLRRENISNISSVKRLYVNPDHEFRVTAYNTTPAVTVLPHNSSETNDVESLKEIN